MTIHLTLYPPRIYKNIVKFGLANALKVAVNVSSSGKPVLRYMYYVNEPGLTLLMKKNP